MTERVGNVILNYEYYVGQDLYSDGDIEDQMLEICKRGQKEAALRANTAWPILYHFTPVRQHILDWYPMKQDATVLEIGAGCGAITGVLSRKAKRVVCIELSKKRSLINAYQNQDCDNVEIYVGKYEDIKLEEKFDYITLIGVLEYARYYTNASNPYEAMLKQIRGMLKPGGKLLIAIENRMGLKYINGANEDHTGKRFDGIYDYEKKDGARTFTKSELSSLLASSGLDQFRFYYPFPDYKLPWSILSDQYEANVGGFQNLEVTYDAIRHEFVEEDVLWDLLCGEGLLGHFANSFFIEAGETEEYSQVYYARYSYYRGKQHCTRTILTDDGCEKKAIKTALWKEGTDYLNSFVDKYDLISNLYQNMTVVPATKKEDNIVFPCIEGQNLNNLFLAYKYDRELLISKLEEYLERILAFRDEYVVEFQKTPEFVEVFGDVDCTGMMATKVSNIDCIFENIMERDGQLYCFDYEWTFEFPVPISFIRFRILKCWYSNMVRYVPFDDVMDLLLSFGFSEQEIACFAAMESHFLAYARKDKDDYMQQYAKSKIRFEDFERAFQQISESQKELQSQLQVIKEQELSQLQAENMELKKKLSRHLQNEERLRKAIKRLEDKMK